MIDSLDRMMQFQSDALRLRSHRQELISANIANADTPNYKAVDFDFTEALKDAQAPDSGSGTRASPLLQYRNPAQSSIDGNSVEMDAERAKFADNTVRYEAAMRVLSAQIKTMLAAVQG
jgi:flagellar basal-body rod protein FlgB